MHLTGRDRRAFLFVAAGLLAFAAACGSGPASVELDPLPELPELRVPPESKLEASRVSFPLAHRGGDLELLLEWIPDIEAAKEGFLVNDYEARRTHAGITAPSQDAGFSELGDYFHGLTDFQGKVVDLQIAPFSWISGIHRFIEQTTTFPYLAFDGRNTDQVAVVGDESTGLFEIVRGRYDPALTAAALAACEICRPGKTIEHRGETFYAWGGDFELDNFARLSPPAYDDEGRGGRIWVDDGLAIRTLRSDDMKLAIDTVKGSAPSLADNEDYRLAARALTAFDVVDAEFKQAGFQFGDLAKDVEFAAFLAPERRLRPNDVDDVLAVGGLLKPFSLAAVGTGFEDEKIFTALVLVHPDEESAAANVERLVERIATGSQPFGGRAWDRVIERIEIGTNGRLLIARLFSHRGRVPLLADQQNGDGFNPLLVYR